MVEVTLRPAGQTTKIIKLYIANITTIHKKNQQGGSEKVRILEYFYKLVTTIVVLDCNFYIFSLFSKQNKKIGFIL